ncbi:MAG: hypothetical protein DCC69_05985 [Hyphomicrobiales bacterium]|nr:MAG: hypothetical protein DCC69_05985 [Hyphomicrobiales bacterium]
MHSEVPPHEKIRFRRSDITALDSLPSAIPLPRPVRLSAASRRAAKIAVAVAVGACAAVALAVAVIVSGLGDERLRREAQQAMAALAGEGFDVVVGRVGVSLDGFGGLALQIDDLAVAPRGSDREATRVGTARVGLDILPLLRGEIRPRSLGVSDASIALAALPRPQGGPGLAVFDAAGLVDPDLVAAAAFDGVRQLAGQLGARGVRRIRAENVAIALPDGEAAALRVAEATLRRGPGDGLRLSAAIEAFGRPVMLRGEATLDTASGRVSELGLYAEMPAAPETGGAAAPGGGPLSRIGAATLLLSGAQGARGDRLTLSGRFSDADIPIGRRDNLVADIELAATAQSGSGKVEIERLRVAAGRSEWAFHGAFGPTPRAAGDTEAPTYRYELVSDGSAVSPEGSPEPTLRVAARVAGLLSADARLLRADEIGVRSGQGEVSGRAAVRFEPGASPGLDLRIDVGEMPVGQAKQLWPWFAATGARNWVMSNVFGGHVEGGWVELGVPPGRFGDGVPLRRDEVSGFFVVGGTRFDVAGRIPPVRDGSGTVAFFGTDVDITLSAGTVFLPSGRTVAASDGTLSVRDAHIKPVVGKLDIDVAGEADAVLELASYDPIDVSRFVDLKPQDLSGKVSGAVAADIPLHRDIAPETLGWRVELAYDDLAVARPFEGQKVSDATGTIVVDPGKAVIEARARLNDLPAELRLVEPLGRSGQERQRHIAIETDDKARRAIAPGLETLLSGVAKVEVEDAARGRRAVSIDLGSATLSLPWVGWSKGPGVPATASFDMATADGRTELTNFSLRGETFAAAGTVSLRGGSVERVRFSSMRLNRGDDVSLDVERKGAGYAVTVRGKSLDARSAVKLHTRDAAEGTPGGGGDAPVSVDLKVDALAGFHGEVLRDVTLKYAGTGTRTDLAEFSAVTAAGEQVVFRDGRDGEARAVSMRSADAGALLRFLDIYERMEGGRISLDLSGRNGGALRGQIDARDFWLVDEPRLSSIVSSPSTQDGRSLNQAVRGSIDTSRVQFERGFAEVVKAPGALSLDRGILRGPLIGVSFQGSVYDRDGNMAMTGTFMPAYGLNRIFGEIPLIGQILGNGRDRGLIGITFRLAGKAGEPKLEINPLSVIAPGIFRSVFEFR